VSLKSNNNQYAPRRRRRGRGSISFVGVFGAFDASNYLINFHSTRQISMSNNCGILHIHINISAILVGRDYPHPEGIEHVRRKWKEAIRNPNNYPGFVHIISAPAHNAVAADVPGVVEKDRLGRAAILPTAPEELEEIEQENERILRKAVGRGRYVS
jgi:hypothetical protein